MKTIMYLCPICGNVIVKLVDSGVVPSCCGHEMQLLIPKVTEESEMLMEKHLPQAKALDEYTLKIEVGSTLHPMSPDHLINFIYLETERGAQIRFLSAMDRPTAKFYCGRDKPNAVYAFCNRHGLWGRDQLPPCRHRKGTTAV